MGASDSKTDFFLKKPGCTFSTNSPEINRKFAIGILKLIWGVVLFIEYARQSAIASGTLPYTAVCPVPRSHFLKNFFDFPHATFLCIRTTMKTHRGMGSELSNAAARKIGDCVPLE